MKPWAEEGQASTPHPVIRSKIKNYRLNSGCDEKGTIRTQQPPVAAAADDDLGCYHCPRKQQYNKHKPVGKYTNSKLTVLYIHTYAHWCSRIHTRRRVIWFWNSNSDMISIEICWTWSSHTKSFCISGSKKGHAKNPQNSCFKDKSWMFANAEYGIHRGSSTSIQRESSLSLQKEE